MRRYFVILTCLLAMVVGFTALFFWMLSVRVRLAGLERRAWDAAAERG